MSNDNRLGIIRGLLRRDLLVLCSVVFLANTVSGQIAGTFSLYAKSLGADVAQVGILTGLAGLSGLVTAIPIGLAADRYGRKRTIVLGMVGITLALTFLAVAPGPWWLAPSRFLSGASLVAAIWISSVCLGDVVTNRERNLAFGFFTTIVGIGYTIGQLIGPAAASVVGARGSYLCGAGLAFAGLLIVLFAVPPMIPTGAAASDQRGIRASLRKAGTRQVLVVCLANFLIFISFYGVTFTNVPLFAKEQGMTAATIAFLLFIRTAVSTFSRFPVGLIAARLGTQRVMVAALVVSMLAVLPMGHAEHTGQLLFWMAFEGLGYGMFVATSQAYIAEHSVNATRGAAMGLFSSAGNLSLLVAPVALGFIGDAFGLSAIFPVASAAMFVGLLVMLVLWTTASRPVTAPAPS